MQITSHILSEVKKISDYLYLKSVGVNTKYGYVKLNGRPFIQRYTGSSITIGKNVTINSSLNSNVAGINHPTILATVSAEATITIENDSGLSGSTIVCVNKVHIGKNVGLGVNTNVYDTDFHVINKDERIKQKDISEAASKPVIINNNVWIGGNCTILKGVSIGDGSVVGSNSLVTKSIPKNCLYGGVPAKLIREICQ